MQPKLCVCDEFLLLTLFKNIPNLSIVVKTEGPVWVREKKRIKEFICKLVYFIEEV
jgi:exosome complex RNA-binding protein Rrp4